MGDFAGSDIPTRGLASQISIPAAAEGFAIPRAPAPSVLSPDFAGGGLSARAGAGSGGSGGLAGHGGTPISIVQNFASFDSHDVRRVLTSQAGQAAIAEAFAPGSPRQQPALPVRRLKCCSRNTPSDALDS
jgi:hypothetical protein